MLYTQHEKDLINRKFRMLENELYDETLRRQQQEESTCKLLHSMQDIISGLQDIITTHAQEILQLQQREATMLSTIKISQDQIKGLQNIVTDLAREFAENNKLLRNANDEIEIVQKTLSQYTNSIQQIEEDMQDIKQDQNDTFNTIDNRIEEINDDIRDIETSIDQHKDKIFDEINLFEANFREENANQLSPILEDVSVLMQEYKKAVQLALKYTEHAHRFDQGKPRAEITSSYIDKDGKLNTEIHWNDEFVQNLVKQGFTGSSDEEVVQMWIANLLHQFRENDQQ